MLNNFENTKTPKAVTYICGTLKLKDAHEDILFSPETWKNYDQDSSFGLVESTFSEEEKSDLYNQFYSRFIECMMPIEKSYIKNKIKTYTLEFSNKVKINSELEVTINKLDFFFMPNDFLFYAFRVEQSNLSLKDIRECNRVLRSLNFYVNHENKITVDKSFLKLLQPFVSLLNCGYCNSEIRLNDYKNPESVKEYIQLVYKGNKFKTFTIVSEGNCFNYPEGYDREHLVFDLATCSPIGSSVNKENSLCPSEEYYKQITKTNSLSFFNNWHGLALFDGFVVVHQDLPNYQQDAWESYYFRLIFVHSLFVKNFLMEINVKFRVHSNVEELCEEFYVLDRLFNFRKISYNFLPQAIYEKIRTGFEINDEQEQLSISIGREIDTQEVKREKRMTKVLTFLALLAMSSAVFDAMSWLGGMGLTQENTSRYQLISSVLIGFVVVGLLIGFYKKKVR